MPRLLARVFLRYRRIAMGLFALVLIAAAGVYFLTPEERVRHLRTIVALARKSPRLVALCRLPPDDPFAAALRARMRWPFSTLAVVAVSVGVFVAMVRAPGAVSAVDTLVAWGGSFGPRTTNGERWRLLTSVFVHPGLVPLLINMTAVAQLGFIVERRAGHLAFVVVYITAGVLGSIVTLVPAPMGVSAGATTAVFGIYGLLAAVCLRGLLRRSELTLPLRALATLAPAAALFLLHYFATETAHTAARIGLGTGLVAGIVLTREVSDRAVRVRRLAALTAATAAIVFLSVMTVRMVADIRPVISAVITVEERTAGAYDAAVQRFKTGRATVGELIKVIDQSIVPDLQAVRDRVDTLEHVPAPDEPLVASTERYLQLRQESWRLRADALRRTNMLRLREAERKEQASLQVFSRVKADFVAQ